MSSESPPSDPRKPRAYSGRSIAVAGFIFLLGIAAFTYYVAPMFVTPYFEEKPAQLQASFDRLEAALLQYANDHSGQFPPEDELLRYRRLNKNIFRSRSAGMTTLHVPALTSPVAYVDKFKIADPYAMPDQWVPPAYATVILGDGTRAAVLSSAGPNLDYDLRPQDVHEATSLEELRRVLQQHTHDPERGPRSGGDFVRLILAP